MCLGPPASQYTVKERERDRQDLYGQIKLVVSLVVVVLTSERDKRPFLKICLGPANQAVLF